MLLNFEIALEGKKRKAKGNFKGKPKGNPTTSPTTIPTTNPKSNLNSNSTPMNNNSYKTNDAPIKTVKTNDSRGSTDYITKNDSLGRTDYITKNSGKNSNGKNAHSDKNKSSSIFTHNPSIPSLTPKQNIVASMPVFATTEFLSLGLHHILSTHLDKKMNITAPTPIQSRALQVLLAQSSNDVIIQAQTGSGKTLAFLLPIVHKLIMAGSTDPNLSRANGAFAIILAPTRELASQILKVLEDLLRYVAPSSLGHWIVPGIVIGGEKKKSEKSRLRKGVNILVCTPGRLLDHLKTTDSFLVQNTRWLVLDEADNLLQLGFEETLKEILQLLDQKRQDGLKKRMYLKLPDLPESRQTILCSATIESGVQKLANESLTNPVFVRAQTEDTTTNDDSIVIPQQLKQHYIVTPAKLRLVTLIGLLRKLSSDGQSKIIVYFSTGDSVDWHFQLMQRINQPLGDVDTANEQDVLQNMQKGATCTLFPKCVLFRLYGNMTQQERQATYQGFSAKKQENTSILLCTDVAARGLDLPDITSVVQYDPPTECKEYVHRIGRTARLGREGQSFLFLLPSEVEYLEILSELQCNLSQSETTILHQALLPFKQNSSKKHKDYEIAATDVHMSLERTVTTNEDIKAKAQKAYTSFVRAYCTHVQQERHIFQLAKLHLGHIAKSFALSQAPSIIVNGVKKSVLTDKDNSATNASEMRKRAYKLSSSISEFADGSSCMIDYNKRRKR